MDSRQAAHLYPKAWDLLSADASDKSRLAPHRVRASRAAQQINLRGRLRKLRAELWRHFACDTRSSLFLWHCRQSGRSIPEGPAQWRAQGFHLPGSC